MEPSEQNTLRAGAIAFLKKLFDDTTLIDALHRAIKSCSVSAGGVMQATIDTRH